MHPRGQSDELFRWVLANDFVGSLVPDRDDVDTGLFVDPEIDGAVELIYDRLELLISLGSELGVICRCPQSYFVPVSPK